MGKEVSPKNGTWQNLGSDISSCQTGAKSCTVQTSWENLGWPKQTNKNKINVLHQLLFKDKGQFTGIANNVNKESVTNYKFALYDNNKWSTLANLKNVVSQYSLNNTIYQVTESYDLKALSLTITLYNNKTKLFTKVVDLKSGFSQTINKNYFYLATGKKVYTYNLTNKKISSIDLPLQSKENITHIFATNNASSDSDSGYIYLTYQTEDKNYANHIKVYSYATEKWSDISYGNKAVIDSRSYHMANNALYMINSMEPQKILSYDAQNNNWATPISLPNKGLALDSRLTVNNKGNIFVLSCNGSSPSSTCSPYIYNGNGVWSDVGTKLNNITISPTSPSSYYPALLQHHQNSIYIQAQQNGHPTLLKYNF